jgi:hypothetical protein
MPDLGNGNIVPDIISKDAIADLDMKPGDTAFAIIKSTEVIIGTPCDCKKDGEYFLNPLKNKLPEETKKVVAHINIESTLIFFEYRYPIWIKSIKSKL